MRRRPWRRAEADTEAASRPVPAARPLAAVRDLRDLRADLTLAIQFAAELHGFLEHVDGHLELAQSARDSAERREHARQAFWHALAAREHAAGVADDVDELAGALLRGFEVTDPRIDRDSQWLRPE
jgi:hypothetical protein